MSGVDYCVAGEAMRVGRMAAVTSIPAKGALPKGAGALIPGTEEATQLPRPPPALGIHWFIQRIVVITDDLLNTRLFVLATGIR